MTNREKYGDMIKNGEFKCGSVDKLILHGKCTKGNIMCEDCQRIFALWLDEESEEKHVDWSKVAVDTKILVSNNGESWEKRHFAYYIDGKVYAFSFGATSWTNAEVNEEEPLVSWKYAKLAEEEI